MFHLFRFEDTELKDAWEFPVSVLRLAEHVEVDIVGRRPYNNGYEDLLIAVASDGTRTFTNPIEVDYFGGGGWYEDPLTPGKSSRWVRAGGLSNRDRYIDAAGNPFTASSLVEDFGE